MCDVEQWEYDERQAMGTEIEKLRAGLENCRLLAARHRKEDWALLILGFARKLAWSEA